LNGYVVNIEHSKVKKLNGKKIRITGEVTIVDGLKNPNKDTIIMQGRNKNINHILNPKIEILN